MAILQLRACQPILIGGGMARSVEEVERWEVICRYKKQILLCRQLGTVTYVFSIKLSCVLFPSTSKTLLFIPHGDV